MTQSVKSCGLDVFELPLKNKRGDIISKTRVDFDIYTKVLDNSYSLYQYKGYAFITIVSNKKMPLSHYVFYGNSNSHKTIRTVIDHINRDRLDNRICNLREVSCSVNNRNKTKSKTASSQYYGVSVRSKKWLCCLRLNSGVIIRYQYDNEIHAAYHYNMLVIEHDMQKHGANLNKIEKPDDFVMSTHKKSTNKFKGVEISGKKFRHRIKGKNYGGFTSAEAAYIDHVTKMKAQKEALLDKPVKYNSDHIAIIPLKNRKREVVSETLIDLDDWDKLKKWTWVKSCGQKYVIGRVNGKSVLLSRFIMNCNDPNKVVDHINRNTLDNRKNNLRILTVQENNQNKSSAKNSSSKYIGVSRSNCKKWRWTVRHGKNIFSGTCNTEISAALAREKCVLEYNKIYGTKFSLNFPNKMKNDSQLINKFSEMESENLSADKCEEYANSKLKVVKFIENPTKITIIDASYKYGFHAKKYPSMIKTIFNVTRNTLLNAVQIYISSPKSKEPPKFDYDDLFAARKEILKSEIYVVIHGCLLYNLAGTVKGNADTNYNQALASTLKGLVAELDYGVIINAGVIVHPGSRNSEFNYHPASGIQCISDSIVTALTSITAELKKIAKILDISVEEALSRRKIILENAAGEGNKLCSTLEELRDVILGIPEKLRKQVRVCFDTAHGYGRGIYDPGKKGDIDRFYKDFDEIIGLKYLELFHFNDSMRSDKKIENAYYGSRKDRHQQLGEGYIFGSEERLPMIRDFMLKARKHKINIIGEPPVSGMTDWHVVCDILKNTKYPLIEIIEKV